MDTPELLPPSLALNRIHPDELITGDHQGGHAIARHGFKIGKLNFLVKPLTHAELLSDTTIYPLPKSQKGLKGMINLRGSLIPVFDLGFILGMKDYSATHVLIIGKDDDAVGILIDKIPTQPVVETTLQQAPPVHSLLKSHIDDFYICKDKQVWMNFNHESFFLEQSHNAH